MRKEGARPQLVKSLVIYVVALVVVLLFIATGCCGAVHWPALAAGAGWVAISAAFG